MATRSELVSHSPLIPQGEGSWFHSPQGECDSGLLPMPMLTMYMSCVVTVTNIRRCSIQHGTHPGSHPPMLTTAMAGTMDARRVTASRTAALRATVAAVAGGAWAMGPRGISRRCLWAGTARGARQGSVERCSQGSPGLVWTM